MRHAGIDRRKRLLMDEPHRLNSWSTIQRAQSENATQGTYLESRVGEAVFRVVTFVTILSLFAVMFWVIAGGHS